MSESRLVTVSHFSDILCIWAYIAQIRIDELKAEFSDQVALQYHFIPIFGAVNAMIDKNWHDKGGLGAYNKHVISVASKFEHITVNPDLWLINRPTTSAMCHLFIKAIQLLESEGRVKSPSQETATETFVKAAREAFFIELVDISQYRSLMDLVGKQGLPGDLIQEKIYSGEAHAALELDMQLKNQFNIAGSPTLVFNEGRQLLYGNVGYRVIDANIRELINQPANQASWC